MAIQSTVSNLDKLCLSEVRTELGLEGRFCMSNSLARQLAGYLSGRYCMSYFLGKTRPQGGAWFVGFAGWIESTNSAVGRHNMDNDAVFMSSFVFPSMPGYSFGIQVGYIAGVTSLNTGKGYWSCGLGTYSFYNYLNICESAIFTGAYTGDNTVRRVTYSTDTLAQTSNNLNTAIAGGSVSNNSYSKGYYSGGIVYTFLGCVPFYGDTHYDYIRIEYLKIIQSINYSDETTTTLGSAIPLRNSSTGNTGIAYGRGGGSKDAGYQISGIEGYTTTNAPTDRNIYNSNTIKTWKTKITYSNETTQLLGIDSYWEQNQIMPQRLIDPNGNPYLWYANPQNTVFTSPLHLYHVIRKVYMIIRNSPAVNEEYITKMSFSTETFGPVTLNNNLKRSASVGYNGTDKGYMMGGTDPQSPTFNFYTTYHASLDEIDFATDTWRYTINSLGALVSTGNLAGQTTTASVRPSDGGGLQSAAL